jgi:hypothetical protein
MKPRPDVVRELLRRPADFIYGGDNAQMFKTWTIGPIIDHRDANSELTSGWRRKIETLRKKFIEGEDFRVERFGHFLVGWVEHLTYKVLNDEADLTSITPIAKYMAKG